MLYGNIHETAQHYLGTASSLFSFSRFPLPVAFVVQALFFSVRFRPLVFRNDGTLFAYGFHFRTPVVFLSIFRQVRLPFRG